MQTNQYQRRVVFCFMISWCRTVAPGSKDNITAFGNTGPMMFSPDPCTGQLIISTIIVTLYYDCYPTPHPRTTSLAGILVSLRPSVRPHPLCSAYSTGWIHFISIHVMKQLQKVCPVISLLQNFKIWFFWQTNVTLTLSFLGIWCESLVWVIMGRRRVSQNAGILVVLVVSKLEGVGVKIEYWKYWYEWSLGDPSFVRTEMQCFKNNLTTYLLLTELVMRL